MGVASGHGQHKQVVVGYDFSHSATVGLYRAIAIAARAPFHVLHFACVVDRHASLPVISHHGQIGYEDHRVDLRPDE